MVCTGSGDDPIEKKADRGGTRSQAGEESQATSGLPDLQSWILDLGALDQKSWKTHTRSQAGEESQATLPDLRSSSVRQTSWKTRRTKFTDMNVEVGQPYSYMCLSKSRSIFL